MGNATEYGGAGGATPAKPDGGIRNGSTLAVLSGIGIGAAGMYLLDPGRGRRRRAQIRDQIEHTVASVNDGLDTAARDLENRARGFVHEAKVRFKDDEAPDEILVARVRTALGRVVSHPGSIIVTALDGRVTLSGPVLAAEVDQVLSRVRAVRGVRDVENRLEPHASPGNIPALQGGAIRTGERFELLQENWAPATRLLVAASGGLLALLGASRRGVLGSAASLAGTAMLARALTNSRLDRLVGANNRLRAVDLQKTINIDAPRERVYEFFSRPENFPQFMSHMRQVRAHGDGTAHLVVDGPAGVPLTWDVALSRIEPGSYVAWKSTPDSTVQGAGVVRFDSNPDGTTRVDIKMSHRPPGGALGHALLRIMGSDPKHQLDDDLARVKTYLETGKPAHDAWAREHVTA